MPVSENGNREQKVSSDRLVRATRVLAAALVVCNDIKKTVVTAGYHGVKHLQIGFGLSLQYAPSRPKLLINRASRRS